MECAFSLIKSRWRILHKCLDSKINFVNKIVIACVVLQNLCIRADDFWDELPDGDEDDGSDHDNNVVGDGENVRQILLNYVNRL